MHVHNVADYAPPGYRLERTDYGDKKCRHTFVKAESPDLVCELVAHDAAEERAALADFQLLHSSSRDEKLAALRAEIDVGDASPVAEGYSLGKVLNRVYAEGQSPDLALPIRAPWSEAAPSDVHEVQPPNVVAEVAGGYVIATSPTEPPPRPKSKGKR